MSTYNDRKALYLQKNVNSNDTYALLLQASLGLPLSSTLLEEAYQDYVNETTKSKSSADFHLILLIRLLYLLKSKESATNEYQAVFEKLSILCKDEKFWLEKGEKAKCYWSENHMICYLSSWYLWNQLHQIRDDRCALLCKTYVETKAQYGFYECYSQVYNCYTLSALLNLYDFVDDAFIRDAAKSCIDRLTKQALEIHLYDGSTFCASGRTYERFKVSSQKNNFNKLVYLLSGANAEDTISPVAAFMATSTYTPISYDLSTLRRGYDVTYTIGNVNFDKVYSKLSADDKTLFQWSAGNYFNEYVDDSIKLINKYNLGEHSHFKIDPYDTILKLFPTSVLKSSVSTFTAFTDCSDLTNIKYHIYNNGTYSLMSLENYNRGKMGAQQAPWIANVGGSSVFTQSGKVSSVGDLKETNANSHMPCINQEKNVILMMYQPYDLLKTYASSANLDLNVYLYAPSQSFDEFVQSGKWIFVSKSGAYLAIYSTTLKRDSAGNYYNDNKDQQGWVVIMGDVAEYGSFTNFQDEVSKKASVQFKVVKPNKSLWDKLTNSDNYYYGKVSFKGIVIEMKW